MSEPEGTQIPVPAGTPLPDVSLVQGRKISVTFERKKDLGNYNNVVALAWVEGIIPDDADETEAALGLGKLYVSAQAAVFDALDIQYIMDDEGNIREADLPVVTVTGAEAAVGRAFAGTEPQAAPSTGGLRVMNAGKPGVSTDPLPEWLVSECARKGITAVWDERGTATGRQPLFKEAVSRGGVGHGKDGTAQAFWPPK